MKRLGIVLVLAMVAATGCRSGGSGDDDDTPDAGGSDDVAIQDIQSEDMPVDTPVTVRGVVVIAVDAYGGRTGAIYVMEPEGGAFSGVVVNSLPSQSSGLLVGDLIDIEGGFKDEFALAEDTTGRTITQITGSTLSLTKTGDGSLPAPEVLNSWDLAGNDAEAEKWEGVLVQFNDVAVTSAPDGVSSTDPLLKEMRVTGPFRVSSALTELADTIARDDCYTSITGIGDYFFEYKILPRDAADLVGGGSGCPAQEAGDTACADLSDNDYDGFMDCDDFSCQDSVAACVQTSSVTAVQDGTIGTNEAVMLAGVYVTGVDFNRKNLWVADSLAGAVNNGVYVFRGFGSATELDAGVVVGARVDVIATTTEYKGLTELSADDDSVSNIQTPGGPPTPLTGTGYATLADAADGETYEGVLVRVNNVDLVERLANYQFSVGDSTTPLIVDDEIYRFDTGTNPVCFVSITGVMHQDGNSTADPVPRILLPRSSADVVTGPCAN